MYAIGIDPGLTGAIALVGLDGTCEVHDMPVKLKSKTTQARVKNVLDGHALAELVANLAESYELVGVYVENVATRPGQGVASNGSLMHSLGVIEGVLCGLGIDYHLVRPQEWKEAWGLVNQEKGFAVSVALEHFQHAPLTKKKHHGRADAILIGLRPLKFNV